MNEKNERKWIKGVQDLSKKIVQCSLLLFDIEKRKSIPATRTRRRVKMKRKTAGKPPAGASATKKSLRARNKRNKLSLGDREDIETVAVNHFEVLIRNVNNKTLDKIKDGMGITVGTGDSV